jgi:hypothetical protein
MLFKKKKSPSAILKEEEEKVNAEEANKQVYQQYDDICEELRRPHLTSSRIESLLELVRTLKIGTNHLYYINKTAECLIAVHPNTKPEIVAYYLFTSNRSHREAVFQNPAFPLLLLERPDLFCPSTRGNGWTDSYLDTLRIPKVPAYFAELWKSHSHPEISEAASLHISCATISEETWMQNLINQLFFLQISSEASLEICTLGLAPPLWEPYLLMLAAKYSPPFTSWKEGIETLSLTERLLAKPDRIYPKGFTIDSVARTYIYHPLANRQMLLFLAQHRNQDIRCATYYHIEPLSQQEKIRIQKSLLKSEIISTETRLSERINDQMITLFYLLNLQSIYSDEIIKFTEFYFENHFNMSIKKYEFEYEENSSGNKYIKNHCTDGFLKPIICAGAK